MAGFGLGKQDEGVQGVLAVAEERDDGIVQGWGALEEYGEQAEELPGLCTPPRRRPLKLMLDYCLQKSS